MLRWVMMAAVLALSPGFVYACGGDSGAGDGGSVGGGDGSSGEGGGDAPGGDGDAGSGGGGGGVGGGGGEGGPIVRLGECRSPITTFINCADASDADGALVHHTITLTLGGIGRKCDLPEPMLELSQGPFPVLADDTWRSKGSRTWLWLKSPGEAYSPTGGDLVKILLGNVRLDTMVARVGDSYSCLLNTYLPKP